MVYKNFGRPFVKIFIGSLVCYQAAYWAWNKLEREDIIHRSGSGNGRVSVISIEFYRHIGSMKSPTSNRSIGVKVSSIRFLGTSTIEEIKQKSDLYMSSARTNYDQHAPHPIILA
ncbi:hypothetical protein TESG_04348 [Trichophyton tonsurans CBS 112818]|uniref:Uncharacterized protein n=1 Tax=Trichophyton tonsurans (strain CBS 112818) TaxID=647933 RepID=F2S024_TRIT1|nr:hypothetical protein TESG_04348 [Trichophyton tonsurans CBS 112818]